MTRKIPIHPDQIRTVPEQFNWIGNQLVRDQEIELLHHQTTTFFLILKEDAKGLSYSCSQALCEQLSIDMPDLALMQFEKTSVTVYKKPFYQLLAIVETDKRNLLPLMIKTTHGVQRD